MMFTKSQYPNTNHTVICLIKTYCNYVRTLISNFQVNTYLVFQSLEVKNPKHHTPFCLLNSFILKTVERQISLLSTTQSLNSFIVFMHVGGTISLCSCCFPGIETLLGHFPLFASISLDGEDSPTCSVPSIDPPYSLALLISLTPLPPASVSLPAPLIRLSLSCFPLWQRMLLSLTLPPSSLHRRIHSGCRFLGGENPRWGSTWSNSNPEFLAPRARRRRKTRLQSEGRRRDGLLGVIVVLSDEMIAEGDSSENGCWASTGSVVRSLFIRRKCRESQPLSRLLRERSRAGGVCLFVEAMFLWLMWRCFYIWKHFGVREKRKGGEGKATAFLNM